MITVLEPLTPGGSTPKSETATPVTPRSGSYIGCWFRPTHNDRSSSTTLSSNQFIVDSLPSTRTVCRGSHVSTQKREGEAIVAKDLCPELPPWLHATRPRTAQRQLSKNVRDNRGSCDFLPLPRHRIHLRPQQAWWPQVLLQRPHPVQHRLHPTWLPRPLRFLRTAISSACLWLFAHGLHHHLLALPWLRYHHRHRHFRPHRQARLQQDSVRADPMSPWWYFFVTAFTTIINQAK